MFIKKKTKAYITLPPVPNGSFFNVVIRWSWREKFGLMGRHYWGYKIKKSTGLHLAKCLATIRF